MEIAQIHAVVENFEVYCYQACRTGQGYTSIISLNEELRQTVQKHLPSKQCYWHSMAVSKEGRRWEDSSTAML